MPKGRKTGFYTVMKSRTVCLIFSVSAAGQSEAVATARMFIGFGRFTVTR